VIAFPETGAAGQSTAKKRQRLIAVTSWALSLIAGEFESAKVKAEGDHLVVGEVSIFDEARGESLHGNGVAGAQLGSDYLEQGLLAAEVDEPLGDPYCIGQRSGHDGYFAHGRIEKARCMGKTWLRQVRSVLP
jgi:hypothetical protein